MARRALATVYHPEGPSELQKWYASMLRRSISPQVAAMYYRWYLIGDLTGVLREVRAPTLVVHMAGALPDRVPRAVAALIPDARLVSVQRDPNDARSIVHIQREVAIKGFLNEGMEHTAAAPSGALVTILFTDITDSTALTQRLGDAAAQELVRAHNTIVRDALRPQGGTEIKHTGDGIMASFPSASGALECAVAIQKAVEGHRDPEPILSEAKEPETRDPLSVHIGLNAGEPVAEEQDLFGTAVQLARRICDHAEGGEILASDVVRQLAAGKGFLFADRGETGLRGFEDPVRLYEVRWREVA
jgi:class 3 adenylate cyclase